MAGGLWTEVVENSEGFFQGSGLKSQGSESERNYTKVSVEIVGRQFRVSLKKVSPNK